LRVDRHVRRGAAVDQIDGRLAGEVGDLAQGADRAVALDALDEAAGRVGGEELDLERVGGTARLDAGAEEALGAHDVADARQAGRREAADERAGVAQLGGDLVAPDHLEAAGAEAGVDALADLGAELGRRVALDGHLEDGDALALLSRLYSERWQGQRQESEYPFHGCGPAPPPRASSSARIFARAPRGRPPSWPQTMRPCASRRNVVGVTCTGPKAVAPDTTPGAARSTVQSIWLASAQARMSRGCVGSSAISTTWSPR